MNKLVIIFFIAIFFPALAQEKQANHFILPCKDDSNNCSAVLNALKLGPDYSYRLMRVSLDAQNEKHVRYLLLYQNLPVEGGYCTVHFKNGQPNVAEGFIDNIDKKMSLTPTIRKQDAIMLASKYLESEVKKRARFTRFKVIDQKYRDSPDELVFFRPQDRDMATLSYKLAFENSIVFVDAGTGKVLAQRNIVSNFKQSGPTVANEPQEKKDINNYGDVADLILHTRYSGVQTVKGVKNYQGLYKLLDITRTNSYIGVRPYGGVFPEYDFYKQPSNEFAYPATFGSNDAALDALFAFQKTYDYFKFVHLRNGFDNDPVGNGMTISAFIHYPSGGFGWDNAAWDGGKFLIGDGYNNQNDPQNYQPNPVASLDILAHEYGHAVTDYSSNLFALDMDSEAYNISEGLSDIFGACVENYVNGQNILPAPKEVWLDGSEVKPGGYRNLMNPKLNGQPNTYLTSPEWLAGPGNDGHRRSTIVSHWFYLLAEGGSGTNDNGDEYAVTGISFAKAEKIIYKAIFWLGGSNTTFHGMRTATLIAADELYGYNSEEARQVGLAWYAVGLASPYCLRLHRTHGTSYINYVTVNNQGTGSAKNSGMYTAYPNDKLYKFTINTGQNTSLKISSNAATSHYWAVYIDLNQDKVFGADELVKSFQGTGFDGNIVVNEKPTTKYGKTWMRIIMSNTAVPDACMAIGDFWQGTYGSGEVEDFKIILRECLSDNYEPNNSSATSTQFQDNDFIQPSGENFYTAFKQGYLCKETANGASAGDEDWFRFSTVSFPPLYKNFLSSYPDVKVELLDAANTNFKIELFVDGSLTPTGSVSNNGQKIIFHPCNGSGHNYCIRVSSTGYNINIKYKLKITLTAISFPCNFQLKPDGLFEKSSETGESGIILYPSPVKDLLNVTGKSITAIEVYDTHGKVLLSRSLVSSDEEKIDFTLLPSGIYIVRVETAMGSESLRVIKE